MIVVQFWVIIPKESIADNDIPMTKSLSAGTFELGYSHPNTRVC